MSETWTDRLLEHAMGVLVVLLLAVMAFAAVVLVGAGIDSIADVRAYDAKVECQQMLRVPMRRPFTTEVRCVPPLNRQDTTTVRLNGTGDGDTAVSSDG